MHERESQATPDLDLDSLWEEQVHFSQSGLCRALFVEGIHMERQATVIFTLFIPLIRLSLPFQNPSLRPLKPLVSHPLGLLEEINCCHGGQISA